MKYPIGIQSFEQLIEDGYVYVDKTALIYNLVTTGKIYFLCRELFPRTERAVPQSRHREARNEMA